MRTVLRRIAFLLCLTLLGACDETPTSATDTDGGGSGTASSSSGGSLTATSFLAFGDSMTAGEVTAARSAGIGPMVVVSAASYPAQLQQRLQSRFRAQAPQIAVANAGRSGELVASAEPRLDQLLANTRTQALLLFDGYNDLLDYGAGGVNPAAVVMDRMAKNGRLRGARVFIALLPPPIAGRQRSVPDGVVRAFNDQLRSVASGEGAVIVDLYRALSSDVSRYIGVDGHHPTEAGYQRIAEEFQARIVEALSR